MARIGAPAYLRRMRTWVHVTFSDSTNLLIVGALLVAGVIAAGIWWLIKRRAEPDA